MARITTSNSTNDTLIDQSGIDYLVVLFAQRTQLFDLKTCLLHLDDGKAKHWPDRLKLQVVSFLVTEDEQLKSAVVIQRVKNTNEGIKGVNDTNKLI